MAINSQLLRPYVALRRRRYVPVPEEPDDYNVAALLGCLELHVIVEEETYRTDIYGEVGFRMPHRTVWNYRWRAEARVNRLYDIWTRV